MNKIQLVVLLFFTLIGADSGFSQVSNSVYSMFGVGQTIDNSFGINKSLGGTGIAFQTGRAINHLNPASYLGILPNSMIIETGAYGIINNSANAKTSQTSSTMNVSYFSTGIYCTNGWAFTFGIVPFSYINYEISSTDEIEGELTVFDKTFKGTGGLNRVNLGNSFKIYKGLAVGLNAAFIFGLITQTEKALSTDTFTGYELKNERRAHSFYLDYGLQYSMDRGDWMYTVGLIYSAAQKLKTTDYLEFTYNSIANELEQDEQSSIKIPEKIGLGIAIKKGRNFKAGFDYEQNHWSKITFSNRHLETNNSTRFSFGTEFCPGQKMNESWFKNIFYRLGANYKNSYLEIDHVSINSMGINLGLGIPINRINLVNFAIEYGEEGTLKKGLIKNSYWGFYLNFSLSELWAVRPRRG